MAAGSPAGFFLKSFICFMFYLFVFIHLSPSLILGTAALLLWLLSSACLSATRAEPPHCACSAASVDRAWDTGSPRQCWKHWPGREENTEESQGRWSSVLFWRARANVSAFPQLRGWKTTARLPREPAIRSDLRRLSTLLPWPLQVLSRFPSRADFEDHRR